MFPIQLSAIALAGKVLLSKYGGKPLPERKYKIFNLFSGKKNNAKKFTLKNPLNMKNPLHMVLRGLTTSLSHIRESIAGVDYYSVVKKFIPDGAELLVPKYPRKSEAIHFADMDGDSQDELLASYREAGGVKTIILKKQNDTWEKAGEIKNPGYSSLNHRSTALFRDGKSRLLLGLNSGGKDSVLYGYCFEGIETNEIFSRGYSRLDVWKNERGKGDKAQVAIWNTKENDTYDVEVLNWYGNNIEAVNNPSNYYFRSVLPYYALRVKQNPYSSSNWYNLAETLKKSEMRRDALIAVDIGTRLDNESRLKDKFTELKDQIIQS